MAWKKLFHIQIYVISFHFIECIKESIPSSLNIYITCHILIKLLFNLSSQCSVRQVVWQRDMRSCAPTFWRIVFGESPDMRTKKHPTPDCYWCKRLVKPMFVVMAKIPSETTQNIIVFPFSSFFFQNFPSGKRVDGYLPSLLWASIVVWK